MKKSIFFRKILSQPSFLTFEAPFHHIFSHSIPRRAPPPSAARGLIRNFSKHILGKVFYQTDIDGIPKLPVCLRPLNIGLEIFGETLKTRAFSRRQESLSRSDDGSLHDGHKSRKICIDLDPDSRRPQLENLVPDIRMLRLPRLPFEFRLCSEKQRILARLFKPYVDKMAVVLVEFVVFQNKVLFP